MQTKAYFASSVPAALEVARQELGENAMLIGSRPAPVESRRFGRLEVTFAYEAERPRMSEMEIIRAELAELRRSVSRGDRAAPAQASPPDSRVPIARFADIEPGESRVLAVIGPPGRGKTTSLVKIAVQYGLARRVPVRIYSAGAHAIGGQEQMARYAAILGTPFQVCESVATLNLALNGDGWKGLLLIDTPGLSPADCGELDEMTRFFSAHPVIEKHLVLRADAAAAEMSRMVSFFTPLQPSRLLFTGLDEVVRPVSAMDTLILSGIPATFCGTGQQIPEDLEPADGGRFVAAAAEVIRPKFRQAAA